MHDLDPFCGEWTSYFSLYYFTLFLCFLVFFFLNWKKIALQCCIGFFHKIIIISHNYTYIPSLVCLPLLLPSHPFGLSQSMKLGSLCYTATSHLSISHMIVHICQCYFLYSYHSLLPLLFPQVCSLHLCLHSFPANRFNTNFPDSIYML